jgi:probable phosphomutase (TIGR03848 family)
MATFYLIRHATNDFVGKALAGWLPGVHLNDEGRAQARRLAQALAPVEFSAIYSSPLERAQETAEPLAQTTGLRVETSHALGEIATGEWTGKTFAQLESDPRWRAFNQYRNGARVPGGETMLEAQARMVAEILRLREAHPAAKIAIVSHADPIRAALVYFLGMPLDLYQRIEILPASFSVVALEEYGPVVLGMNHQA